jgi:hypothetical protein
LIFFFQTKMGFGLWKKIKNGIKKVIGGIGKGAKTVWEKVIKPVGKAVLPIAGRVVGGFADKFIPGSGAVIGNIADSIAGSAGGGEPEYQEEAPPPNGLIPRLKPLGANGHGIRNLILK